MSTEITKLHNTSQIPQNLNPFRPDERTLLRPKFVTNGSIGKAPFLRTIGVELLAASEDVRHATEEAEAAYHTQYGDGIFGPYMDYEKGVPYSVVLAAEKMKGALTIMARDNIVESIITHDVTYLLKVDGHEGEEVTIHKAKSEQDRARVAQLLYWASTIGKAHLCSVAGLVRFDESNQKPELYSTETDLGIVQPFDMERLLENMRNNPDIALGTSTYKLPGFLIKEKKEYPMIVTRYKKVGEGELSLDDPTWRVEPEQTATATFSADTPVNVQLAGLGFIQW